MLRKLLFWWLKRECGKRNMVFVNIRDGYIMDFEIEEMTIEIENKPKKQDDSPYEKIFTDQTIKLNATLNGLWMNMKISKQGGEF